MAIDKIASINHDFGIGKSVDLGSINTEEKSSNKIGDSFENFFMKGVQSVNEDIMKANKISQEFLTEGKHELHEVIIGLEKAELNFRFMTQVRNKVLDAYQEVMRMQV